MRTAPAGNVRESQKLKLEPLGEQRQAIAENNGSNQEVVLQAAIGERAGEDGPAWLIGIEASLWVAFSVLLASGVALLAVPEIRRPPVAPASLDIA